MQGRPSLFVDFRLVDRAGLVQPHDGRAQGELQVRGLHVAREYFRVRRVPTPTASPEPLTPQPPPKLPCGGLHGRDVSGCLFATCFKDILLGMPNSFS